jgi:hypothetical protein
MADRSLIGRITLLAVLLPFFYFAIPIAAAQSGQTSAPANNSAGVTMDSEATPHAADGKPDLTGLWAPLNRFHMIVRKDAQGRTIKLLYPEPDSSEAEGDAQRVAQRKADPNQPPYKPDLLAKVRYLEDHTNQFDGDLHCMPPGVPRIGAPQQIVQIPGQVVFLYNVGAIGNGTGNYYRVFPTDGRAHRTDLEPSYFGDSVGHWDSDTLVVDVIGFNDLSWIGSDGRFHSEAMHVIERFTRSGDTLKYEVTVEDPNVFTKPWQMNPRVLKLDPTLIMTDTLPCVDRDSSHLVTNEHH